MSHQYPGASSRRRGDDHDLGGYLKDAIDMFMKYPVDWILIGIVGALALGVGSWGGYHNCALKQLRGEKPSVGDVLFPSSRFVDFFVMGLMVFIGLMLCLVPGIYLSLIWFYAPVAMIDRDMSRSEACDLSKAAAGESLGMTFVVALVAGIIGGLLSPFTLGLTGIIQTLAYKRIFGGESAPAHQAGLPAAAPAWSAPAPAAPAPARAPAPAPAPAPAHRFDEPTDVAHVQASLRATVEPEDDRVETAAQSTTNNPDEIVKGKTMAMSAVDFEKFIADEAAKKKNQG